MQYIVVNVNKKVYSMCMTDRKKEIMIPKKILTESVPNWQFKVGKKINKSGAYVNSLASAPDRASEETFKKFKKASKDVIMERIIEISDEIKNY
jgi:hypothetical protein